MTHRSPASRREAQAVTKMSDEAPLALASILFGPYVNKLARHPERNSIIRKVANSIGGAAVRRSSIYPPTPNSPKESVAEIYKQVGHWHGTGRYQYRSDGSTSDILQKILEQKGLLPNRDIFDPVKGEMQSISLAESRMYARAYADMHGKGEYEDERYGSSMFWSMYFIGSCVVGGVSEMEFHTKAGRQKFRDFRAAERANPMRWWDKVHSDMWGLFSPFRYGSDIEGNYPIVIGVKDGVIQPVDTSRMAGIHEIRTCQPIGIEAFSHMEVPRAKITETEDMLGEFGHTALPVIAIEDGESHVAQMSFLELVRPVSR